MSEWQLTVGLEIHVELETKTKMFCGCPNDPFHPAPNTNVCPVCYGLPGALPLINQEAVAMTIRFGQAIGAKIPTETFWARKNYFYPDLPKGYQISQMALPLVQGGKITIDGNEYHLDHAHLEEDAGKLVHERIQGGFGAAVFGGSTAVAENPGSLVDYNRAGVPLLEIVTKPDFHSAESAKRFCQELQRIMRSLKLSSADMEKGMMRCEANISVSKTAELGTKVEVKNINSFRAVEKAIQFEFERQTKALENGETIQGETRNWNDASSQTVSMRTKETGADYRYFPEPDLPRVAFVVGAAASHQLPEERRQAIEALGAPRAVASALVDKGIDEKMLEFDQKSPKLAKEAAHLMLELPPFAALSVAEQIKLLEAKQRNGWTKTFIEKVLSESKSNSLIEVIEHASIIQGIAGEDGLLKIIDDVIRDNSSVVADFKAGKGAAFNSLVGKVLEATNGRANVQTVRDELQKALSA